MSMRKGTTPLRSTATTAPLEATIVMQQSQITGLVAEKRALERDKAKLQEGIAAEKDRSQEALVAERERTKDALSRIQERWAAERTEWREGCDAMQSAHRVAHLHTARELEKERMAVLWEKENVRRERLARAHRDYKLVLFQSGERAKEKRLRELEEELEEHRAGEEARERKLRAKCDLLADQLRGTSSELTQALKEKEKAEEALSRLRIDHTTVKTKAESASRGLERAELQIEGLKSSHGELETKHAESERTIVDLRRQLEKWRTLEDREGAEVETLRKARIDLEVRVRELETRAEEAEKDVEDRDASIQKFQRKLEKYKAALEDHVQASQDAEETIQQHEQELKELRKQLTKAEKQIISLNEQLAARRTNTQQSPIQVNHKANKAKTKRGQSIPNNISDDEVVETSYGNASVTSTSHGRPKPRPAYTGREAAEPSVAQDDQFVDDDEVEEVAVPSPKSRKAQIRSTREELQSSSGKRKRRKLDDDPVSVGEEDRSAVDQKGKRKAAEKPKKRGIQVHVDDDDDGANTRQDPRSDVLKPQNRGRGASKKPASKSDVAKSKPPSRGAGSKPSGRSRKDSSVERSKGEETAGSDVDPPPKKKKRKIFPTANAATFAWDSLGHIDGGLDIPTVLSPVKDGDIVPPRTQSILGGLGSIFGAPKGR